MINLNTNIQDKSSQVWEYNIWRLVRAAQHYTACLLVQTHQNTYMG